MTVPPLRFVAVGAFCMSAVACLPDVAEDKPQDGARPAFLDQGPGDAASADRSVAQTDGLEDAAAIDGPVPTSCGTKNEPCRIGCGKGCQTACEKGVFCEIETGPEAEVTCRHGANCVINAGPRSHIVCQAKATCAVTTKGSGHVDCRQAKLCRINCQGKCEIVCGENNCLCGGNPCP